MLTCYFAQIIYFQRWKARSPSLVPDSNTRSNEQISLQYVDFKLKRERKTLFLLSVCPRGSPRKGSTVGQFTYPGTLPFSPISLSFQMFPGFIQLAGMHLDFTFEGLGFHFLDTCPIKASLSRPTEVFSCVATIHGHFAINVVRQVVAMHLMRREWLFCPFFFLCSLFRTQLPSSPQELHQGSFIPNSRPSRGQVGTLGIVISEIIPNPLLVKRVLSSDLLSLPPLTTFDPCPPTDNI